MSHPFKISRFFILAAPTLAISCVPPGDGVAPPEERVYFPVGISVSEDAEHLFVINSDFDLKYAQGTIQSLRLERLRELARRPCAQDADCEDGQTCDTEPTSENSEAPSFFCVDASDPRPCGDIGEKTSQELSLAPGRCQAIELDEPPDGGGDIIEDVAETSAFATQGLLLSRPCEGAAGLEECPEGTADGERVQALSGRSLPERLFVPVRGDTTVHYLDIDDGGRFVCGRPVETSEGASFRDSSADEAWRCGEGYRIFEGTTFALDASGDLIETDEPPDPDEEEDEKKSDDPEDLFRLPQEPLELAGSSDGRVIVVSHQLEGRASTIVNSWVVEPELVHILRGLEENPIGVAALPRSPGASFEDFYLTYRSDAEVELLRFADDGLLAAVSPSGPTDDQIDQGATVFRPELSVVATSGITLNSVGYDSRGIVVDSTRREQAVEACATDADCLALAEETPLDVYVANRSPNSLLVGRTAGADPEAKVSSLPEFYKSHPLTAGPSRVVIGHVTTPDGQTARRIFVLCFDSALIYVFDPERGEVESTIRTGRGPYSMAFDPIEPIAFVGHFTDSHVGVVSLDQRLPLTFGTTLATFGTPTPPRAAK